MAEYFINADTGDDGTGDGSSGLPWLTLAHAYDNSTTSDTITCQTSTASFAWVSDTIFDRTIRAANSSSPATFDGSAAVVQWIVSGSLTLEYLIFQNASTNTGANPFWYYNTTGGHTITFTGCQFNTLTIDTNVNAGMAGTNSLVGINTTLDIVFDGCLFDDLVAGASAGRILFVERCSGSNNRAITHTYNNCTFYFTSTSPNSFTALFSEHAASTNLTVEMTNCIVSNDTGGALNWESGAVTTSTLDYCDFYNLTGTPSATNSITTDPLFVDVSNSNFNLRPTSPAIATGTAV